MSGFLRCFRLARLAAGLAPQQMGSSGPLKLVLKVRFANWDHHEALAVRDVEKGKKGKTSFWDESRDFVTSGMSFWPISWTHATYDSLGSRVLEGFCRADCPCSLCPWNQLVVNQKRIRKTDAWSGSPNVALSGWNFDGEQVSHAIAGG